MLLMVEMLLDGREAASRSTVLELAVFFCGGVIALRLLPSVVRARDRVHLGEGRVSSLRRVGEGEVLRLAAGEVGCWGDGGLKGEIWPQCRYEGDLSYLQGEDALEPGGVPVGVVERVRAKSIEGVLQGLLGGVAAAVGVWGLRVGEGGVMWKGRFAWESCEGPAAEGEGADEGGAWAGRGVVEGCRMGEPMIG